jgi:phage shock protein A
MDRISTLIKADAHGVVESIEDRRLLAKQILRDARLALDGKRARIAELQRDQQRLTFESKRLAVVMTRLDEDVALALEGNNDDLARAAVRKLLPLREADRRLRARLVILRDEETRSAERVGVQEQELEVLKARLQAELAAESVEVSEEGFERPVITDDDVELELLRRRRAAESSAQEPNDVST